MASHGQAIALVLGVASSLAHADVGWRAGMLAAAGFDDHAPVPDPTGATPDGFVELRPQLSLAASGQRGLVRLDYSFLGRLYFTHGDADTWSNALSIAAVVTPRPTVSVTTLAGAMQTNLASYTLAAPSGANAITLLPQATRGDFLEAHASARLDLDLSPLWRFSESASLLTLQPLDAPALAPSWDEQLRALLERQYPRDLVGGELRAELITYGRQAAIDARSQVAVASEGRWRHDLGRWWSTELHAGPLVLLRATDGGDARATAVGGAAVYYVRETGAVDLTYDHAVAANGLIGTTLALDRVVLRGGLPLPGTHGKVLTAASIAWQHGATLDGGQANDAALVDVTLTWNAREEVQVFARWQLVEQLGSVGDAAALERNLVMLGVTAAWPPSLAEVPTRPSVRADRGDERGPSGLR